MQLSVVVPLMNEEDNIQPLYEALLPVCQENFTSFEMIFVDDGSTDATVQTIANLNSPFVKTVVLNRNFGQSQAMAAGIDHSAGSLVVTLDGDLQNDPSDIPMMVKLLQDGGYDVVAGIRAKRQDNWLRTIPSKIANWLIGRMTGVKLKDYGCTLKVFRKKVAKNLGLYGELHRFIPILAQLYGAKITEVPVKHHPRIHGVTKYGISRTLKVVSDLFLMCFMQRYGLKPMHLFGTMGTLATLAGFGLMAYLALLKITGAAIGQRPLLMMGILLFVAGIQLITTGFLAEILMRTYYESQNKKPYTVRHIVTDQALAQQDTERVDHVV